MNGPVLLHLVIGVVLLGIGATLLRKPWPRGAVGWGLCVLGIAFAVSGFAFRLVHEHFH